MLRPLLFRFLGDASGEMMRSTAKAAAMVGLFSIGTAWYLSDRIEAEKRALDQLAAHATGGSRAAATRGIDMSTTGSITRGAQSAKLDPCVVPEKR